MNELEPTLPPHPTGAPGKPPIMIGPETAQSARPGRRYLAPLISGGAVLAVAISLAVGLHHNAARDSSRDGANPAVRQPADPHEAAIRTAQTIIATAPTPPGASQVDQSPLAALNQPAETPGAQHVQETRFWTAPGSVADAISYLSAHLPQNMRSDGGGSLSGPDIPTTRTLDFQAGDFRSLEYSVVSYRGGIAIRADARVLWAPRRSPADTVPGSVSSVDVLVLRQNPQLHQGAPTVRRTLTGTAARALSNFVNLLPRAVPTGYISCPADIGGERWSDELVFHSGGPSARVEVNLAGCASATFAIGHRKSIQLSFTYPGAIAGIDRQILSALGLPANYGR